jgi:hypothetical protein
MSMVRLENAIGGAVIAVLLDDAFQIEVDATL